MPNKEDKIGSFWVKQSANGGDYMSGEVELNGQKLRVVAFPNGYKQSERHPDWILYVSRPRGDQA